MSREAAYGALFALLQGLKTAGTVKTCDRRVRFLDEMAVSELPALFMAVDNQQTAQTQGLPARRTLGAKVYLYAANPDRHTAAGIVLNGLIDALDQVLMPQALETTQSLGGIVAHAWIDGPIEVFEGPLGERAAAVVTIHMLVP